MINQLQISKIDNGWLVATPPVQTNIIDRQTGQPRQEPGEVNYCADVDAICDKVKELLVVN